MRSAENHAGRAHEHLHKLKLTPAQADAAAAARHHARRRIERDTAESEDIGRVSATRRSIARRGRSARPARTASADNRPLPFEARYAVVLLSLCGKHHDGCFTPSSRSRQTSTPFIFGIITSRTIASYSPRACIRMRKIRRSRYRPKIGFFSKNAHSTSAESARPPL